MSAVGDGTTLLVGGGVVGGAKAGRFTWAAFKSWFSRSSHIDNVIASAARPARAGSQDSRALQSLKKKVDRKDTAFTGLLKSDEVANELISQTLGARNTIVRNKIRGGRNVQDTYNSSTGIGVRTIDGSFDTDLEPQLRRKVL